MVRKFLVTMMMVAFFVSCASKDKNTGADPSASDSAIEQTDMNFDPQGSDSGNIDGLKTVNFGFDEATLSESSRQTVQQNAEWLKNNSNVTLQVEGHADSRGSTEYNLALGERRAQAVKSYMESLGISGDRLSVTSYGQERPLVDAENESAWAANRRVNFVPIVQ